MLTFNSSRPIDAESNTYEVSGFCLSTDTKPTELENGRKIANGSSLVELDTKKVFLYDEENSQWRLFS